MMKKTNLRLLSVIVVLVLMVTMAWTMTSCADKDNDGTGDTTPAVTTTTGEPSEGKTVVGEGKTTFSFTVTMKDGTVKEFTVKTDAETVGAALLSCELIAGEDSAYGLYVKTVCGETLDYNTDGKYWAFYIDGAYASTGVDATKVAEGAHYEFRAE